MNRGKTILGLIILAISLTWLVILPRLAMTETVRDREAWLEHHRIDPAAMFYTELPLLDAERAD